MHPTLFQQIQQHLGSEPGYLFGWQPFAEAVQGQYQTSEQDLRLLRGVMDAVPDMMTVKSPQGRYLACNRAFEQHNHVLQAQILGKTDFDVQPAPVALAIQALDTEALQSVGVMSKHVSEQWFTTRHTDGTSVAQCIETTRTPLWDEYGQLTGLVSVGRDVTEQKRTQKELEQQAQVDVLTALPNRRSFMQRLDHELRLARRSKLALALLLIGLDKFKEVNEGFGHPVGDAVLAQTAERIQDVVRETDVVARMGGDEFAVIIPNLKDITDVERISQNLIRRLSEVFEIDAEHRVQISASIGIALYPSNARDGDVLLHDANQAMYFAKTSGRARFSHFTFHLQEAANKRARLARDLRRAIEVKQFEVVYQPIVNLATGQVQKAEAFLRWHHEGRGLIRPADFIPLAEDSGLIIELGDWVFQQAAREVKHLRSCMDPNFQISINQSPVQLRSKQSNPQVWLGILKALDLPGDAIALEVTEGLLLIDEATAKEKLRICQNAGMEVAVDDFGSGMSALSYLKKDHLDYLKIDHQFVQDVPGDAGASALCEAIIALAHKMGIRVIAEGVATEAQHYFLANAGCDFAQGSLFSMPVSVTELQKVLTYMR